MADPAHLQILKQGVEAWNASRERNWKITPALRKANLVGANLTGANLSHVSLSETVFSNTNLTDVQGLETCEHSYPG